MTAPRLLLTLAALALSSCSARALSTASAVSNGAHPDVGQKGNGAQWVHFTPKTTGALYSGIVAGPDGNMWFIDENASSLVRTNMTGGIKEFRLTAVTGNAVSMAVGADGKFYIGDESTSIVQATTSGASKAFSIPSGDNTSLGGLALGPEGDVWFTEFNHVAKITPSGTITEFAYPSGSNQYGGITAGADGNMWFAESAQNAIGRIVPATGKITMFPIPVSCIPTAMVLAKDNAVWFACLTSPPTIGRITKSGTITTYNIGGTFNSNETESFCARGPDGQPWCASGDDGTVIRVNVASHTATTFTPPLSPGARPDAVAAGPDGNVWVDTVGGDLDVLVMAPITLSATKLTFSGPGQMQSVTVSQQGVSSWTASSSNTAVATVAQGANSSTFDITSAGAGTCKVTIADGVGNSATVKITVL